MASGDKFSLGAYQLMASLAEHYSLGLPGMGPFIAPLHGMVAQFHGNEFYRKKPSSAARLAIEVWRVVALLSLQKNAFMCRSLRSLLMSPVRSVRHTIGITDASPTGLGIGLFDQDQNLISYMGYQFPFHAIESKYQCAREYFGYMFCFFFLEWVLGTSSNPVEVGWINDNKAAIAWATSNKCNSQAAQYAFLVVTWMHLTSRFRFSHIEHHAGVLMGDIDGLSRGYPHSLDITKEYVMSPLQSTKLDALFRLLDPSVVNDVEDHHRVFDSVLMMARSLMQST